MPRQKGSKNAVRTKKAKIDYALRVIEDLHQMGCRFI